MQKPIFVTCLLDHTVYETGARSILVRGHHVISRRGGGVESLSQTNYLFQPGRALKTSLFIACLYTTVLENNIFFVQSLHEIINFKTNPALPWRLNGGPLSIRWWATAGSLLDNNLRHWPSCGCKPLINPYNTDIFLYKPWRPKGFSICNYHKCISYVYPLHLNTYLMGLRTISFLNSYSAGIDVI